MVQSKFITIKIDRELHNKLKKILGKDELKYKYPSVASFANDAIFEKLDLIKRDSALLKIPQQGLARLGITAGRLRRW